jgi:hypothetical protein
MATNPKLPQPGQPLTPEVLDTAMQELNRMVNEKTLSIQQTVQRGGAEFGQFVDPEIEP